MLTITKKKVFEINVRYHVLALILSFLRTLGMFFYMHKDDLLTGYLKKTVAFGMRLTGYFLFFELIIYFLNWLIKKKQAVIKIISGENAGGGGTRFKDYLIFVLVWFPSLLIKYPGAMCWDTWRMLYEYRNEKITTHHSVLYTICLGRFVDYFEKAGHPNLGLWFFLFLQFLITVLIFGYSVQVLRKLHLRKEIIYIIIGMWALNPYIIGYQGVAIKDYPYALSLFLLTDLLIELCIDEEEFYRKKRKFVLLCLAVMGTCLLRKNGFYIMLIVIVACLNSVFRRKVKYLSAIAVICFCAIAGFTSYTLKEYCNAAESSVGEALSLPFQQTARYVKYHGDDVTMEEREVIDRVLDYGELANDYNPRIADPVKNKYKRDEKALLPYFKVWFKQFLRHPLCYLDATWEQNYYLFVPEASQESIVFYQDANIGYELGMEIIISERTGYYEPIFTPPALLIDLQRWVISEYNLLHRMPVINIFGNISFYIYLLIGMTGVLIINKKEWLPAFSPAIATFLFALLGPVIQGHPRYLFPIVYSAPVLLTYVLYECRYGRVQNGE